MKNVASGTAGSTKDKAGEASERERESNEQLNWAKEKAKEGYDAAKATIASNLDASNQKSQLQDKLGGQHRDAEL
ncbi:unnamed protein product [Lupinus luteus]|uniref:Uncharacterized protein n=1 Tax=Lupinus luteus TaxID=3873 RepID=A0AAV1WC21_LUPLU